MIYIRNVDFALRAILWESKLRKLAKFADGEFFISDLEATFDSKSLGESTQAVARRTLWGDR